MIGKVIQTKRKAVGLTQAQVADRLGVTASAVNRWEKGLSFPDTALLAPLARLLKTDLNELFSFYETLSDKERELAVDRAYLLLLEKDDREALAYIAETLRQNLSDGELYKKMAKVLYGFHVLKKVIQPDIYLDRIAEYYEYALQLLPEEAEDISYSLLNVYSEQGDAEKAEKAWERLSDRKCDKKWTHAEMFFLLKNYSAAIPELEEGVLRAIIELNQKLYLLKGAYQAEGDKIREELAGEKADMLCREFGLWEGFRVINRLSGAITAMDTDETTNQFENLIALDAKNKPLSSCLLFEGITLENTPEKEKQVEDRMADLMRSLARLQ